MKKKILMSIMAIALSMTMMSPVWADSKSACVAIGADNTEAQLKTVYGYFGISRGAVEETVVTNADERQYLGGQVSSDKIGSLALSSVYVQEKTSGGIEIETKNIDWVTEDMYKAALTTAGITNAKVIVAAYTPVSGTGALTGIYKAYEAATGTTLDEAAKTTAVDEVVVTGELQDAVGDDAVNIINSLKTEIAQTKGMSDDEIRQLIKETATKYDTTLTDDQIEEILGLVKQFNELNMDPDTFVKLLEASQKSAGFFDQIQSFFQNFSDFFTNLSSGK
ncbi:DUF1002 domain-containing protein [Acetobacterium paludosum]|uniref:DUF1002 domain-containing protein n=1 Tax=Acetobacterium paludosum TaxID=52693 RepID=A0A923HUN7_9FIRM|nr:DUF1002 domain-containing protein [Acetobacterium paludosum]MBC3888908.1 DUF1002 domain-containing protein [Acetobacterium paludosum]